MSYRILVCDEILLHLASNGACRPPSLADSQVLESCNQLKELIESETEQQIKVFIPPIQILFAYLTSKHPGYSDGYYMVKRLLQFGASNLDVDEEIVWEQANHLSLHGSVDLDIAAILIYANLLKVDAVVALQPSKFQTQDNQGKQEEFTIPIVQQNVPIVNPAEFFNKILGNVPEVNGQFIFPLTPEFAIRQLPVGATPIDFAYLIHSEIGNHCVGAKVNGSPVPLSHPLHTGDVVEIQSDNTSKPNAKWLDFVVTSTARKRIHHGINAELTRTGWYLIKQSLGDDIGKYQKKLDDYAEAQGCSLDVLANKVGNGVIALQSLRDFCYQHLDVGQDADSRNQCWALAACCNPLVKQDIQGIIRSGNRLLKVHSSSCSCIQNIASQKLQPLEWNFGSCLLRFSVVFQDKADIVRPILNRIVEKSFHPNLKSFRTRTDKKGEAVIEMLILSRQEWIDLSQELRQIPGVQEIIPTQVEFFK